MADPLSVGPDPREETDQPGALTLPDAVTPENSYVVCPDCGWTFARRCSASGSSFTGPPTRQHAAPSVSPTRFTVEERAARFQRRHTGPWETVIRRVGPVEGVWRRRRRTRIEYVQLAVAMHDLQRAFEHEIAFPLLRRIDATLRRWPWLYRRLS